MIDNYDQKIYNEAYLEYFMTKRRAKRHFILTAIIVAVLGILTFVSFPIPFSIGGVDYEYKSILEQITLGHDLGQGVTAVYSTEVEDGADQDNHTQYVQSALAGISQLLENEGYSDVKVGIQDDTSIRIEIGGADDAHKVENLIGEPGLLRFCTDTDIETSTFLTGEHVTSVSALYGYTESGYNWGVQIVFDEVGKEIYATKTGEIAGKSGSMYIFLGETQISSAKPTEAITGGSTFITSPDLTNEKQTNQLAFKINLGTCMLKFDCESCELSTAINGSNSVVKLLIAMGIVFVAIMLIMWLAFGDFGLLADLSLVIFIIMTLFLSTAIPGIEMNVPALVGMVLSFAVAVGINMYYFKHIKREYENGKTFVGSIKQGWKRCVAGVLDISAILAIFGICLAIFGTATIKAFAFTFLIGLAVAVICSLLITRRLMTLYMPFNYDNARRVKLKQMTANSEVADEK